MPLANGRASVRQSFQIAQWGIKWTEKFLSHTKVVEMRDFQCGVGVPIYRGGKCDPFVRHYPGIVAKEKMLADIHNDWVTSVVDD